MKIRIPFYLAIFSIVVLYSSCSTVAIHKTVHESGEYNLDRVLIIGLTNNHEARSMYEEELSYRLRDLGYHMFSSVNVDPNKKDLFTLDELIELVEEKDIDGVITMRLKEITSEEKYSTSDRYISDPLSMQNYFFNYANSYYNVYSWSYQPKQTVVVEANLFDAKNKKLIYQIEATITNVDSEEERAGELTKSFAKSLVSSGFLKPKDS
jgi:hypothetical protein